MYNVFNGEPLPEWAKKTARPQDLEVMQQAYTLDGAKNGNAVIVKISIINNEPHIDVITECGNYVGPLNMKEFNELFKPGKWVMKSFPTTQSRDTWDRMRAEQEDPDASAIHYYT